MLKFIWKRKLQFLVPLAFLVIFGCDSKSSKPAACKDDGTPIIPCVAPQVEQGDCTCK